VLKLSGSSSILHALSHNPYLSNSLSYKDFFYAKADCRLFLGYENPHEATGRIVCANFHLANKPVDIEVPQAVLPDAEIH
jgi:hypothetical protein